MSFQIGAFQSEYEPKITKQMLDNFPYQLVQTSASGASKNKNDKKSESNASNDENVVTQVKPLKQAFYQIWRAIR